MIFATAIATILSLFLAVWCWTMARRPRHWRLWWLSNLRQIDLHSTSEERRHQDALFRSLVMIACLLSVLATAWGAYWTWSQWSEGRQHPSRINDGIFLEQDAATAKAQGATDTRKR